VLLEIVVIHDRGTLEHIRQNRSLDPSFYANLDKVDIWCTALEPGTSSRRYHMLQEIKLMLRTDASARPTAKQLLIRISGYDIASTKPSIFGKCCAVSFVTEEQCKDSVMSFKTEIQKLQSELGQVEKAKNVMQEEYYRLFDLHQKSDEQRETYLVSHHHT
jgi:hypothetical protein